MDAYNKGTTTWTFPGEISFDRVTEYDASFSAIEACPDVIFDLSGTTSFHSAFIGFLIHARHTVHKNGGFLHLKLSFTAERLLALLNILDYFIPYETIHRAQKSA